MLVRIPNLKALPPISMTDEGACGWGPEAHVGLDRRHTLRWGPLEACMRVVCPAVEGIGAAWVQHSGLHGAGRLAELS